jgi:hypothetical protein
VAVTVKENLGEEEESSGRSEKLQQFASVPPVELDSSLFHLFHCFE